MKKIALVFILAVLAPSLVLALLAARSLRDQQFVLERQQALLFQSTAESIANQLRETMNREKEAFTRRVDELLQDTEPRQVALDFDTRLRAVWPLADVGFAVTMDGIVLAPSLLDGDAATRFRRENDSFLSNRETAEVYSAPQNQFAYNNLNVAQQAPMEESIEDQKLKAAVFPNAPATDALDKNERTRAKEAPAKPKGSPSESDAKVAEAADLPAPPLAAPTQDQKPVLAGNAAGEGGARANDSPKGNAVPGDGIAPAPAAASAPAVATGGSIADARKEDATLRSTMEKAVATTATPSAPKPAFRSSAPTAVAQKGSSASLPGQPNGIAAATSVRGSVTVDAGKSSSPPPPGGAPGATASPAPLAVTTPSSPALLKEGEGNKNSPDLDARMANKDASSPAAEARLTESEPVSADSQAGKKSLSDVTNGSVAPGATTVDGKKSQSALAQRADEARPVAPLPQNNRDELREQQLKMANESKRRALETDSASLSNGPATAVPQSAATLPPPAQAPASPNNGMVAKDEAAKSKSLADSLPQAQNGGFNDKSGLYRANRAPVAGKTMQRKLEPQKQFADNEATVSRVAPAEAEFRQLIGGEASGALARFLQNKLTLMVWYRSPRDPQLVFGAQLSLEKIVAALRESMVVDAQIAKQICVAVIDDNGKPVFRTHPDFVTNWKRPFVATEIGDVLPHWEVAVYLLDPDELNRTAATLHWTLGGMICVMLLAISAGGWLIIADLQRQLILARQKTDFVSNVSHELKTPLTSIRMFSEMLLENRSVDAARRQTYAQIISAEAARLTRLINNVLDFARIERGEKSYQMRRCDLAKVTHETLGHYLPHLEANGFQLTTTVPDREVAIEADCDAIAQIILNLLSNAEKYGGEKKSIELELRAPESLDAKSQQAEIIVRDRGLGVPAGCERAIFEQFFRAHDALSSGIQGSGLGLTLSRQIARAHGGDIVYARRDGSGSCFTLRLPLASPEKAGETLGPAAPANNVSAKATS